MIKKWDVTIPSLTGDAPRRAYIYLPEYYDDDPNRRFPVMYMFDGQNIFLDTYLLIYASCPRERSERRSQRKKFEKT